MEPPLTMRLGAVLIGVVLLACTVGECTGSSLEEFYLRVRAKNQLHEVARQPRAASAAPPPCPHHPPPIPQAFISSHFLPERLREATKMMDASIREYMRAESITVASVGLVYDQELVWEKGYGLTDPSSPSSHVNSDTILRIGSITKLITNIMLFQLRDRGILSLDDPVSKHVPELVWPTPFGNNPGITWRTLAGQVSGLTGVTPCNFFTIWEPILGDACDITNAEAWKRVTAEPPTAPMWQDPHYADGAYAIIGRALESVVGMTWEDYLVQHIFKPLGMDSTFVAYDGWSDMAKRVAPGMIGNTTIPYLLSQMDLRWARPTGNVYSTVKDLAKLASVFLVGRDERKNALGLYSSTLREMMTPSFVNDDQSSGYAYPFEVHHSSYFGPDLPAYWIRLKGGVAPGYFSTIALMPEIKTALILQSTGSPLSTAVLAVLLPAMEQTLWELQPLPDNPGNLTAYAGTYLASLYGGLMQGNVTVQADLDKNTLNMSFAITGLGSVQPMGHSTAVWEESNSFRILGPSSGGCLDVEAGRTNALVHFKVSAPSMWNGFSRVLSVAVPVDPFYGWDFVKQ